jgi:hypothetical protein
MGERPEGKTLDRKKVNGNYEPDNCRWASKGEQSQNTRSTRLNVEDARKIRQLWSEGFTLSQLATLFGVHRATIQPVVKGRTWKEDATASVLDETDVLVVPRQELCPLAALSE